jgi:membrane associated rhomboid family serine protease
LARQPDLLSHPWRFYQLLTYGFAHSRLDLLHIVFNMLGLWFFGRDIEWRYGRTEFLTFYLSCVVLAGLGWIIAENITGDGQAARVVGASGAIAGVFMLYALNFPRRMLLIWFVLPVPAWLVAALWLLMDINGAIQRSGNVAFTCHLAGAAFGFLYFRTGWTLASLMPKKFSWKLPRSGPRLRIHDPDEMDRDMTQQVDEILRKIQEHGQDSLTKQERRILEEASRRYQQKHR